MATPMTAVLEKVIHTVSTRAEESTQSDRDLLRRFAENNDQSAFTLLVERYGGMVLGVCRRSLSNLQDAEDACQATFLVLARKAASGRWSQSLANWLYTTARRVASNARVASQRRTRRESRTAIPESLAPVEEITGRELLAALDEELDRLHARYREPLVLCYLEGLTRDEAAARLGVPVGTVKTRLERGRQRLHDALTRRGLTLGAGLLALTAVSSTRAASSSLVKAVTSAIGNSPPAAVAELARGVIMNAFTQRLIRVALATAAAIVLVGISAWAAWPAAGGQAPARGSAAKAERPSVKAETAADKEGRAISGRVVDSAGKPVAKATIVLAGRKTGNGEMVETAKELTQTDANGDFRCVVPPGGEQGRLGDNRKLVARAPGNAADWIPVREVDASRPLTLRLGAAKVRVRGRVLTLEGKPITSARVRVLSLVQLNAKDGFNELYRTWNRDSGPRRWRKNEPLSASVIGLSAEVEVDAQGRFEIPGVGDGYLLRLAITAENIEMVHVGVVLDPAFDPKSVRLNPEGPNPNLASGAPYRNTPLYGPTFDHVAKPCRVIQGRVFDQETEKPLANVPVMAHTEDLSRSARTVTDSLGKFQLLGLPNTQCKLMFNLRLPKATPSPYLTFTKKVGPTAGLTPATVDMPLIRGTVVTGRITDRTTGKPVMGAIGYAVLLGNKHVFDLPAKEIHRDHFFSHGLDADGRFRFVAPPGLGIITYYQTPPVVRANKPYPLARIRPDDRDKPYFHSDTRGEGYFTAERTFERLNFVSSYRVIEPAAGQEVLSVDFQLDPGKSISGKAVGPDAQPLTGVRIAGLMGRHGEHQTRLSGAEFTIKALLADDNRTIAGIHADKKLAGSVVVRGKEKGTPLLRLARWGVLTGRIVTTKGKPLDGVYVHLSYDDGTLGSLHTNLTRGTPVTSDAAGRFRIDTPFAGQKFTLMIRGRGKTRVRESFGETAKSGQTKDLGDIVLKEEK